MRVFSVFDPLCGEWASEEHESPLFRSVEKSLFPQSRVNRPVIACVNLETTFLHGSGTVTADLKWKRHNSVSNEDKIPPSSEYRLPGGPFPLHFSFQLRNHSARSSAFVQIEISRSRRRHLPELQEGDDDQIHFLPARSGRRRTTGMAFGGTGAQKPNAILHSTYEERATFPLSLWRM